MRKQLLLLEDVYNVGRKGDLVTVKPGYARNYLIPQLLAIVADRNIVKIQSRLREEREKQAVVDRQESEKLQEMMNGLLVVKVVKVDPEGNMYGSVTALDIVNLLAEKGIKIEKHFVLIGRPLKEMGAHTINLRLKEGVEAHFNLKIIPEGQAQEAV